MNIEIANRLVNLRKEKGLSQEQLAERIGVSRQAVSKWERSEASPDTDNLIMLARLYAISLDELLRTEEEIPMPQAASLADDGGGENPAQTEKEAPKTGKPAKRRFQVSAEGISLTQRDGIELRLGRGGFQVRAADDSPEAREKALCAKKRAILLAAAGLIECVCAILFLVVALVWRQEIGAAFFVAIPVFAAAFASSHKGVKPLFIVGVAVVFLLLAQEGLRGIWMSCISLLLIPTFFRLCHVIERAADRITLEKPPLKPNRAAFTDSITRYAEEIDLVILVIFSLIAFMVSWSAGARNNPIIVVLPLLCISFFHSCFQAIRERDAEKFSIESMILFLFLSFYCGYGWSEKPLFTLFFAIPAYHWLCRQLKGKTDKAEEIVSEESGAPESPDIPELPDISETRSGSNLIEAVCAAEET